MNASRRVLGGALIVVTGMALAPAAQAYELLGPSWFGSPAKVRYHSNLSTDGDRWALRKAVAAWNDSGVKLRLRSVSRRDAKVLVRRSSKLPCGYGYAPYTYSGETMRTGAVVLGTCSDSFRYTQSNVATHEFGHILGLDHEDDRCAQMNSRNSYVVGQPASARPFECPPPPPGQWRCRLVNRDDLRGAKSLYGGDFELGREFCDLPDAATTSRSPKAAPRPVTNDLGQDAIGSAEPRRR